MIVSEGTMRIDGDVHLPDPSYLKVADFASLHMTGSVLGSTLQESAQQLDGTLLLNGNGTDSDPQLLEAKGANFGAVADGFDSNFSYGRIEVESTYVRLQDLEDNAFGGESEALYVDQLFVGSGSTLDLNGVPVFVRQSGILGDVIGEVITVPDGGPLAINSSSPGSIETVGERDEWTFFGRASTAVTVILNPGQSGDRSVLPPYLQGGRVSLIAPDGSVIATTASTTSGETALLSAVELTSDGTYTVRVEANEVSSSLIGNYSLSIYNATVDEVPLNFNERVFGQLENRFSVDRWIFQAEANDQVQFDLLVSNVSGLGFRLLGPAGWSGFAGATSDSDLIVVPTTGQYELVAATNGQGAGSYSFRVLRTTVVDLSLGIPIEGSFVSSGSAKLYRFEHDGTSPLAFAIAEGDPQDQIDLYVRFGEPPTRRNFDRRAGSDGATAAVAPAGTGYVLLHAQEAVGQSPYTLRAEASSGLVNRVSPNVTSQQKGMSFTFTGVGFAPGTEVVLTDPNGNIVSGAETTIDNLYQATTTFDLSEAPVGHYDATVTFPDGSADLIGDAIEVLEAPAPSLSTKLVMPDRVGRHALATIYVEYSNVGDAPMPAPILTLAPWQDPPPFEYFFYTRYRSDIQYLSSSELEALLEEGWQQDESWVHIPSCPSLGGGGEDGGSVSLCQPPPPVYRLWRIDESKLDKPILTLDQSLLSRGFWTNEMPDGFSSSVQIYAQGETPGLLLPGESVRVPVYYAGQLIDALDDALNMRLFVRDADSTDEVDFSAFIEDQKPDGISDSAWSSVIRQLQSNLESPIDDSDGSGGLNPSWGDYISMLSENAQFLSRLGRDTNSVSDLFAFEYIQANGLSPLPVLASAVDGSMPSPGLSLTYGRSFGTTIAERNTPGPYGYGWQAPAVSRLQLSEDGTVNVYESEASVRRFQPDLRLDGDYITAIDDAGTLKRLPSGEYRLREVNGLTRWFSGVGQLQYTEDRDGNRITYSYDGEKILAMTHSSGATLDFAYNTRGFIESITDSTGWTKNFAYHPDSDVLVSATSPAGTTRYTYVLDGTPSQRYAMDSIEDPTGIVRNFEYDEAGRLTASYIGDQVQRVEFEYDQPGRVTIRDQDGVTSRLYFDHRGQLARSEDGTGNYQLFEYDAAGYLISSTDATGATQESKWSDSGQYLGGRDRALNDFRFEPGGPFGQAMSFSDVKGNGIRYSYTTEGNLKSRTFADGTVESFNYDSKGNVVATTSRRGQAIQRSYNTLGQLTAVEYPDQTGVVLTYDSKNRLETVNDDGQVTQYSYNDADRVTRIDYPKGRWIAYQYDGAGRRTRLEDHSGHVLRYVYDEIGRLERLLDGGDSLIVSYQYDDSGRVASETRGNGTRSINQFDSEGRILSITNEQSDGTINSQFVYTYDSRGRRTEMSTIDGNWAYKYDSLDQLIRAEFSSTNTEIDNQLLIYEYDAAGNRTRTVRNGVESNYSTNNLNQITSVDSTNYEYDLGGNLIRKAGPDGVYQFTYDVLERLVAVSGPEGDREYEHDAFGNRIAEVRDGIREEFLIDPTGLGNVIGAYVVDGTRTETYTHGFGLESMRVGGQEFHYDFDAIGSTVGFSSQSGAYANEYVYSPFGVSLHQEEALENDFKYVGQFGVSNSMGDLHYMRARFYVASDGKFISSDPVGLASGDSNFYRYAGNQPTSRVDPSGLFFEVREATVSINWYTSTDPHNEGVFDTSFPDPGAGVNGKSKTFRDATDGHKKLKEALKPNLKVGNGDASDGNHSKKPTDRSEQYADKEYNFPSRFDEYNERFLNPKPKPKPKPSKRPPKDTTPPDPSGDPGPPGASGNSNSVDPNEKLAVGGFGEQGFIALGETIPYRIRFENLGPGSDPVPDRPATAPAQRVVITDQLSTDLDWSTLRFTEYGFGEYLIAIEEPSQYHFDTLPVVIDGNSFEVEVEMTFDSATGSVRTVFQSIDPTFGLPPEVLTGFLPPEDGTEIGQGFIEFSIEHNEGLADGTVIRNIAEISFDEQTVIATNQVDPQDASQGTDPLLEAPVTIDSLDPTSTISAVHTTSSGSELTISWTGDDGAGSGIASYSVFVSIDGSEPVVLLHEVDSGEMTIPILAGADYEFFVSAVDNVGNAGVLPEGFSGDLASATHDYGDAISSFPVYLTQDGARHLATGPRLGSYRDAEFFAHASSEAMGDDLFGNHDDEDGVTFPGLHIGKQGAEISINVQEASSGAFLNAWIDFNGDGQWSDGIEKIADAFPVADGVNVIEIDVPADAFIGTTYARFRISSEPLLGTSGAATDGEVEDYAVEILRAPPGVSEVQINEGGDSRSMITSLTVTFDTVVDHASFESAFSLTNITTGQQVSSVIVGAPTDQNGQTAVSLTFGDGVSIDERSGTGVLGNSLSDGNYRLEIVAEFVRSFSTDQAMANDYVFGGKTAADEKDVGDFFRLLGDVNGDGLRNGIDLQAIVPTLFNPANYDEDLDTNGDGQSNGIDLQALVPTLFGPGRD